jgi:site-specific DNA-methyltransferase (adenine-specific)
VNFKSKENIVVEGNNLAVLAQIESESVDLIYIDPPFNTGIKQSRKQIKTKQNASGDRVGFKGQRYETTVVGEKVFDDKFDDFMAFIRPRMNEAFRILKTTGTLYFHIDYREVHYCKIMLDSIFGRENFLNEIIWAYDYGARPKRKWPAKHDNILVYVKDQKNYTFVQDNIDRIPYMAPGLVGKEKAARGKLPTDTWWHTIVSPTGKEKTGYPTQKPLGVLRRIIQASSREGELVLDFFAGSGTTGVAAMELDRKFILIDQNPQAIEVMKNRFADQEVQFITFEEGSKMNNSEKTFNLGQSLWYDNIERKLLENGELAAMIERKEFFGVTSNPSIFNNAIGKSSDYDAALIPLAKAGKSALEIYEALAIEDIKGATNLFLPLYEKTGKRDGYVSLEVNPHFANLTDETTEEAERLWNEVGQPNLMIKIPATKEGLPAIRQTIAKGINVNVTLIFSIERYREVMDAYLLGLEDRANAGESIADIHSVASFFISRIDGKADAALDRVNSEEANGAAELNGKIAIANAKLAYQAFLEVFESDRFKVLQSKGANLQRPLWASTSTKNASYPDVLYIDMLIGKNTVNTVPPKTLSAFNDHGVVQETLGMNVDTAKDQLAQFSALGISLSEITTTLEIDGVASFSAAFTDLLGTIESRITQVKRSQCTV